MGDNPTALEAITLSLEALLRAQRADFQDIGPEPPGDFGFVATGPQKPFIPGFPPNNPDGTVAKEWTFDPPDITRTTARLEGDLTGGGDFAVEFGADTSTSYVSSMEQSVPDTTTSQSLLRGVWVYYTDVIRNEIYELIFTHREIFPPLLGIHNYLNNPANLSKVSPYNFLPLRAGSAGLLRFYRSRRMMLDNYNPVTNTGVDYRVAIAWVNVPLFKICTFYQMNADETSACINRMSSIADRTYPSNPRNIPYIINLTPIDIGMGG